jgi:Ca2+-binding RTX toxin-like protein
LELARQFGVTIQKNKDGVVISTVSNTTDLLSALHSAHDGDTILLAAGNYSVLSASNLNFANGITIASADDTHPAVLAGINLQSSSGVTFKGLEVTVDPRIGVAVNIGNDNNIHLDGLNIHDVAGVDGVGVNLRNSTNVTLANSNIHDASVGVQHLDDSNIVISGNYIHNLQGDGIKGGGSSYVTINNNYLTDFTTHPGDHPDAIQFWTVNTTTTAHDITITNNVYSRGAGDALQGIFMGNENDIPYQNVTISGNAFSGTMYHGISVFEADNVHVTGNFVQGYSDMTSWIMMQSTTNSSLDNNEATSYMYANSGNVGLQVGNDASLNLANIGDESGLDQWLRAQGRAPDGSLLQSDPSSGTGDSSSGGAPATDAPAGGGQSSAPPAGGNSAASPPPSGGSSVGQGSAPIHADGDQTLVGAAGGDTVMGGSGNDAITGGADGVNYLRGGQGDDHMVGGAHFDDMNGNEGSDTMSGGAGDDWVVGGKDNDNVSGDDGNDIVYGNLGSDTCNGGAGADIVRGGQGDDVVVGGAGDDWLSGDRGNDTLTGGAGADTFHSFSGAGIDVVTDFNAAEGDRVQLDPGTHYTLSQVGADTHIDMDNGDEVILQGVKLSTLHQGWIFGA